MSLAAFFGVAISSSALAQQIGPSTRTEPYLLPTFSGVQTISLFTTGDSIGGYRMSGTPDGIGIIPPREIGTAGAATSMYFEIVVNHEFSRGAGVTRKHGSTGAFVSRWLVDRLNFSILGGRDQNYGNVWLRNGSLWSAGTTSWERFCSADLPKQSAFYFNGLGTPDPMFLNGEETAPPFTEDHGRAFAHVILANTAVELPALGKGSIENVLASPYPQVKTVVMISDDANRETNLTQANTCRTIGQTGCQEPPSELHMYVGTKQSTGGNPIQLAGLSNGNLFGIRVRTPNGTVVTGEDKDFVFGTSAPAITTGRFEPVNYGDVTNRTGVQIQDADFANQVMQFIRIEDGAWDPRPGKERDYYFVTTGRITSNAATWRPSRLWRLRFDDITRPEAGGEITMLLTNAFYPGAGTTPDNDPTYQMFDNMAIDALGRIVLLEDVGADNRRGRVYVYGIDSGDLVQIAVHNPKFFSGNAQTNPNFLTTDEEASGVIDAAPVLGDGWFLLDTQNHKASTDPELVEGGQLQALFIPRTIAIRAPGN
jgi:hypothetical protein